MPQWRLEFYVDAHGQHPVEAFIAQLSPKETAQALRDLDLLKEFGNQLREPYACYVQGDLWELRPGANRLFYFLCKGRRIIVLHAYRKKRQKAPPREIATALRRMHDWVERNRDGSDNRAI